MGKWQLPVLGAEELACAGLPLATQTCFPAVLRQQPQLVVSSGHIDTWGWQNQQIS
jgi:hypothetical protein